MVSYNPHSGLIKKSISRGWGTHGTVSVKVTMSDILVISEKLIPQFKIFDFELFFRIYNLFVAIKLRGVPMVVFCLLMM